MNPYLAVIGIFAAGGVVIALLMAWQNRRRRERLLARLRRQWGEISRREYTLQEIENISHYARRRAETERFYVDDITWNDLDMDRVFVRMNETLSSPGEDYLYYLLRTPQLSKERLCRQEELVEFFDSHPAEREIMQLSLARVGKGRYGSVSDAIFLLEDAVTVDRGSHWAAAALFLGSLAYMLVQPVPGIFFFLLVCMANSILYYAGKDRKTVDIYLFCFSTLLKILDEGKKMERLSWPQISGQMERMKKARRGFSRFQRGSFLVTAKEGGSENLAQVLLEYLRMAAHVDLLKYNAMLSQVKLHREEAIELLEVMGELDAAIAMASFRRTLPYFCRPQFSEEGRAALEVRDLYHPLIADAVANSIKAGGGILVTGSNASGKSTFLKNIAICALMAQTVNTCPASFYEAPMMKIYTSMALRDNLEGQESYFIVEIKSLKRILDAAGGGEMVLCIVDEVLRGTNTVERIAASSRILQYLARPDVICFAATHDGELSYILEGIYENYHFQEEITREDVNFNYLLQPGRATTRNALRLLALLNYEEGIVKRAKAAAADFEETGRWSRITGETRGRAECE